MSLFRCVTCGCIENTSLCNYFYKVYVEKKLATCSECDAEIGKWHGKFQKRSAKGMLIGEDGFLYSEKPNHTKIMGEVT